MRVLLESGARQNYNLGDVIPPRRNGLHIPRAAGVDSWMRGASRWEGGTALKVGEIYQQLVPH